MTDAKPLFAGSIPEYYDRYMGPAQFEVYAEALARRVPAKPPGDVLELACGTGLATRYLRERLDPGVRLVATDISKAMLDYASAKLGALRNLEFREADAGKLPFADGSFGAVACAFGVMFVPDKAAFFREARRVLAPGGTLAFSVWDRVEENAHALAFARVVEAMLPGDPDANFRTPFAMHDKEKLREQLRGAGFTDASIETVRLKLDRVSAKTFATGQVRGTPRGQILAQRGLSLDEVIDKAAAALAAVGGADPYVGMGSAILVDAR